MPTSEILICFDTEDFTSSHAADSIRDGARLLTQEGVRANYMIVGLLAGQFIAWNRQDVLDALRHHEIHSHSWGHSMHPTICEYTDIADYQKSYDLVYAQEAEGMGMIKAATGADRLYAAVPGGNSVSAAALYAYADLGFEAYCDNTILRTGDGRPLWFCNLNYMQYVTAMESYFFEDDYSEDKLVELIASRRRTILYNHPNRALYKQFWDGVNYRGENKHPWGEWEEAPRYSEFESIRFFERMRALIKRLKAEKNADGSPRFAFRTISETLAEDNVPRTVVRSDMPVYLDALRRSYAMGKLDPLALSRTSAPRISLCEALYAASRLIAGESRVNLDGFRSHGFLAEPQGIAVPAEVSFDEITRALKSLDFSTFLPPSVKTGRFRLGPADLLMAALELICEEKPLFTLTPRMQQADYTEFPDLRDLKMEGTWLHAPSFKDEFISDRLRLQGWTLRG